MLNRHNGVAGQATAQPKVMFDKVEGNEDMA